MANQPNINTYVTEKVSFTNVIQARGGDATNRGQDARLLNCFIERLTDNGQIVAESIISRAGLAYEFTSPGPGSFQRGIFESQGAVYTVTNNKVSKNGIQIITLTTSIGAVGFVEFFTSTNQIYVIVLDGTTGWIIDSLGVTTQITDPDFPSPHLVNAVFLDGYLFVAKQGTADIYNCVLDTPSSWTAGDFITAEMYPDQVIGLYRQGNYIVAFGNQTIEYFYDAGNSPGTPLERNPSAFHHMGSSAPNSISTFEETILFIGNSQMGSRTVYMLEGFKVTEIASDPIKRIIESEWQFSEMAGGFVIRTKGHAFYVLNLISRRTLVYDLLQHVWSEWTNADGSDYFGADFAIDHPTGRPWLLMRYTGDVMSMRSTIAYDQGTNGIGTTPIKVVAISNKVDYGSMNRKFANRFTLVCDSTDPSATIDLAWSDDDYKTWSTERTMTMSDTMTTTQQLGYFRRRAWRLTYQQPYPLRVEGAELTVNMGTT